MSYLQVGNTFYHLLKELEPFIDTSELRLAFDKDLNAYIIGAGFSEQLHSDPKLWRRVRQEMIDIIGKHVPRVPPNLTVANPNSADIEPLPPSPYGSIKSTFPQS